MILSILFFVVAIACFVLCGIGINKIINIGEHSRDESMYFED